MDILTLTSVRRCLRTVGETLGSLEPHESELMLKQLKLEVEALAGGDASSFVWKQVVRGMQDSDMGIECYQLHRMGLIPTGGDSEVPD